MIGGYLHRAADRRATRRSGGSPGRSCSCRSSSASASRASCGTGCSAPTSGSSTGSCSTSASSPSRSSGSAWTPTVSTWAIIVVGRLEGHRLRDDPVRRRDPGDPDARSPRRRWSTAPATGSGSRRVTLPLTLRTVLLVTLVSVIGSLLAFDQFYIMTAGPAAEPDRDVGLLRLPQLVPVPEAGLRRGAVADPGGRSSSSSRSSRWPSPAGARHERRHATAVATGARALGARLGRSRSATWSARSASRSARSCCCRSSCRCSPRSSRPPRRRRVPPTYFPHELSLDSYQRLWDYQAGLPTYLANSFGTAFLTIAFTLALTVPAGYAPGPVPDPGQGAAVRLPAAGADHPVPGAADADLPDVRPAQADQHARRPGHPPHRDPAAVQPVHHAQQLRGGARASSRRRRSWTARNSWQVLRPDLPAGGRAGDRHRGAVRLHHVVERVPRRAGDDEQGLDASRCR